MVSVGVRVESSDADVMVSMSEFKNNPAAVLRDAKSRPVAVLRPGIFPIGNLAGLFFYVCKIVPVRVFILLDPWI